MTPRERELHDRQITLEWLAMEAGYLRGPAGATITTKELAYKLGDLYQGIHNELRNLPHTVAVLAGPEDPPAQAPAPDHLSTLRDMARRGAATQAEADALSWAVQILENTEKP